MKKLETILQCPVCFSSFKEHKNKLICIKNKHQFIIKEGIPILFNNQTLSPHSRNQQSYFEKRMTGQIIDIPTKMNYWKVRYLQRFIENFNLIKNRFVIEVGIGSGYMTIGLAQKGAQVIACDITFKNLIALKNSVRVLGIEKNVLFVCCSADMLPFKKDVFDYFVMNSVLEHIPAEKKVISEIDRILKKDGGLMITVPVKYKYIFPPLLLLNFFHDKRIGHLRRYDEVNLKGKLYKFSLKRTYFTGHPLKVLKVIVNMIVKVFDEKVIEDEDAKKDTSLLWSSNLIAFFKKS